MVEGITNEQNHSNGSFHFNSFVIPLIPFNGRFHSPKLFHIFGLFSLTFFKAKAFNHWNESFRRQIEECENDQCQCITTPEIVNLLKITMNDLSYLTKAICIKLTL